MNNDLIRSEVARILGKEHDEPKRKRTVDGLVTEHKKTLTREIVGLLFEEDLGTIAKSVSKNIVQPYIKDFIVDTLIYAVEKAVYGSQYKGSGRAGRVGRTVSANDRASYSGYYDSPRKSDSTATSGKDLPEGELFAPVIMKSREKAEELIAILKEDFLWEYSCVTINDLNDTLGRVGTFNTTYYGWRSLDGVTVRRVYDGYLVVFPKPIKL